MQFKDLRAQFTEAISTKVEYIVKVEHLAVVAVRAELAREDQEYHQRIRAKELIRQMQ